MSWVRIWIHLVFSTKKREPILEEGTRTKVFQHIKQNADLKEIHIDSINGYSDHCHILLSLGKDQNLSKVVQLIKGESSFWINQKQFLDGQFVWQDDYWAVSVSEGHVQSVREYIWNQENHHKHQTFVDEINGFMKKYGWQLVSDSPVG